MFSPGALGPRHRMTTALMNLANPRPQFPGTPPTLPGAAGSPSGATAGAPAPSPMGAPGAAPGMPGMPGMPMMPGAQPQAGGIMPGQPTPRY